MRFATTFVVALLPAVFAAPTGTVEKRQLSSLTGALDPITSAATGTLTGVLSPAESLTGSLTNIVGGVAGGVLKRESTVASEVSF